jgi:hypothetical protein
MDLLSFACGLVWEDSRVGGWQLEAMGLLQLVAERGGRVCRFLEEVFVLGSAEEETLFLEYSGITPVGCAFEGGGSSRRLLNVMKVKELVDKITEEVADSG